MTSQPSHQVEITEDQASFFRENGFLSIQRITTDAEVERLKEIYNQLFDQRTGEKEGRYFDLAGPSRPLRPRNTSAGTRSGSHVSPTQGD